MTILLLHILNKRAVHLLARRVGFRQWTTLCFLTVSLDILFHHARGCGIQRILGVACMEFGGLASAPQPISMARHSTVTVAYINHQGGRRSCCLSQCTPPLELDVDQIAAFRSGGAQSWQLTLLGEWRLHPQAVQLICSRFGEAQVDLFASQESSHCQLYPLAPPPGMDALAHIWCKYTFPQWAFLNLHLCKIREDEEQTLLVSPYHPIKNMVSNGY